MRLPLTLPPPTRAIDLVTLGENSLDLVAVVEPGVATASKQPLRDFRLEPGGQMATAALGSARLGLRTRYIGVFGTDEWSTRARAPLDAAGVEVVATIRRGIPGRMAVILVDAAGERTVLERRDLALVLAAVDVPDAAIVDARILLVDATQPAAALRALDRARAAGVVSISDVDQVTPDVDAILSRVDVAIVPEAFVATRTATTDLETGLARLTVHCRHAAVIVATRGAAGSLAWCNGQTIATSGVPVDVVDTTGAGDAFRAGFATALIHLGSEAPLEDILRFANVTGALNCRAVGAQAGLPTLAEVMARL